MSSSELDWARRLRDLLEAPASDPPAGAPALPRYDIREKLGEGATAVVWRAWDRQLQRTVALKVLRDLAGLSEVARERFAREARAAAGLAHPNVVTVHDAGEHEGRLFLVMELVEGRPLDAALRELASEERGVIDLVEKIARGVAAAHAQGIVHRDLKPQNVLVTREGVPKVGDFGLAHLLDSGAELTRTGTQLGTPLYMAPEQVEGRAHEITPRTDVYALGAILYEALAGRPPHDAPTVHELYGSIVRREPPPPRALNPRVSRDVQTVILKALEKQPAGRYADAAEMADDLRRVLQGEPIAARPVPAVMRLWRRAVRNRAVVIPTVLAVALALAFGAWGALGALGNRRALREALDRAAQAEHEQAWEEAYAAHQLALQLDARNATAREGAERVGAILRRQRDAEAGLARAQEELERVRKEAPPEPLPEGDVILREDFEHYSNRKGWSEYGTTDKAIAIVSGGRDGGKCLRLTTRPQFLKEAAYLYRKLPVSLDVCHVRYYVRYAMPPLPQIHQGLFLLANNAPTTWPQVRENQKAQGDTWFMTGVLPGEDRRTDPLPGYFRVASNWYDSDRSREVLLRPQKIARIEPDRWVCVELRVRCNTPGQADGEQVVWIDGMEIGRWSKMRWRSHPDVLVNGVWLLIYFGYVGEPAVTDYDRYVTSVWFDDVVVSKTYVGPAPK